MLSAVMLAGCDGGLGGVSREDVAWAPSPDGQTHAIVVETNGGATTSFGYRVELHPAGHDGEAPVQAADIYGALRSACAYGVDLRWLDPTSLAVQFRSAERIKAARSVLVGGRPIRIVIQSHRINPAARCGGMAYSGGA